MNRRFPSAAAAVLLCSTFLVAPALSEVMFRATPHADSSSFDPPAAIAFAPVTGAILGGRAVSEEAVVKGSKSAMAVSASGGELRVCASTGCSSETWETSGSAVAGQKIQVRVATSMSISTTSTVSVSVGSATTSFSATTRSTPASLGSFGTPVVGSERNVADQASQLATMSGYAEAPVVLSGDASAEYRICEGACGPWTTSSGTVRDGAQIQVRIDAGAFGTTRSASVAVGSLAPVAWSVSTRAADTVPDAFSFAPSSDLVAGTVTTSQPAELKGFDDTVQVSLAADADQTAFYQICATSTCTDTGWTRSPSAAPAGSHVRLKVAAAASGSLTTRVVAGGVEGSWTATTKVETSSYAFTTHTFSNCGATGRFGPTQAQCRTTYNTAWDESGANFGVPTNGYQLWTVPATASYRIVAYGANGGIGWTNGNPGHGRIVTATFSLTQGQKLLIAVGQRGFDGNNSSMGGGGGGGSFVALGTSLVDAVPLVVAAGGAGIPPSSYGKLNNSDSLGVDGRFGNSGDVSRSTVGAAYYGNGASFSNDGRVYENDSNNAKSFRNGLVGGLSACGYNNPGGFGGGGGSRCHNGGGGGGYTGGAGGKDHVTSGEGGGSYIAPSATSVVDSGVNAGTGMVVVTKL